MKYFRKDNGITLVALVVTIVVLLILAGITITMLFSDNGIIRKAQQAASLTNKVDKDFEKGLENLVNQMGNAIDGSSLEKLIASNNFVTSKQGNQIVSDRTGKKIIVPVGFKVTTDSKLIDEGIVIEDKQYNQYVWVPVSEEQFSDFFRFYWIW